MKQLFYLFRSQAAEAQLSLDSAASSVGSDSKPGQVLSGHRYLLWQPPRWGSLSGREDEGMPSSGALGPAGNMPRRPTFLSDTSGWETSRTGS